MPPSSLLSRAVVAISFKKTDQRLVPYLNPAETQALLDAPDPTTRAGIRERAMLPASYGSRLRSLVERTGELSAEHSCLDED
jgi:site-specific recombinase XerD